MTIYLNASNLEYTWRLNLEVVSNCLIQEELLKSWSSVLTWYPKEKISLNDLRTNWIIKNKVSLLLKIESKFILTFYFKMNILTLYSYTFTTLFSLSKTKQSPALNLTRWFFQFSQWLSFYGRILCQMLEDLDQILWPSAVDVKPSAIILSLKVIYFPI